MTDREFETMSTVAEPEIAEKPGKAAKSPVIRRTTVNEDDFNTRLMNRFIPASVISGALHVIVIGGLIWLTAGGEKQESKLEEALITTQVEEPKDSTENLTNEDIGLDADLAASTAVDREENVNVLAPKSDEAVGLENQPNETAPQTQIAGLEMNAGAGSIGDLTDKGLVAAGEGGGGGAFTVPGMQGRMSGATKDKLLKANGGNTASEAAVASGLNWLARKQLRDGSWEFDGTSKDKVAATGMALLPFLAAGETHKQGKKYKKNVEDGLNWLMGRVGANGMFAGATAGTYMYSHSIATVTLCEAAGMTRDPKVKERAALAVNYIVRAQAKNGSWGYTSGTDGDTSIVGWQIQALSSARLAEIRFDREKSFKEAEKFLVSVSSDSGAKYGYRDKNPTKTLIPVGLLSRYYMGWTPKNPAFARGVDFLVKNHAPGMGAFDMYYYYYATQVAHFYEGPEWHKIWNPKMRDLLVGLQDKSGDEKLKGSWAKDTSLIGSNCGRLGTTVLAMLTLEVYYRHLPLYKRDSAGLAELER
jgi:hypothetical protein